jgi:DNA-binding transcriptional MerR regulator
MAVLETTSTAARKLQIPQSTLIALERRGVVPRWQRDAAGRRLISSDDIAAVQAYLDRTRKAAA